MKAQERFDFRTFPGLFDRMTSENRLCHHQFPAHHRKCKANLRNFSVKDNKIYLFFVISELEINKKLWYTEQE